MERIHCYELTNENDIRNVSQEQFMTMFTTEKEKRLGFKHNGVAQELTPLQFWNSVKKKFNSSKTDKLYMCFVLYRLTIRKHNSITPGSFGSLYNTHESHKIIFANGYTNEELKQLFIDYENKERERKVQEQLERERKEKEQQELAKARQIMEETQKEIEPYVGKTKILVEKMPEDFNNCPFYNKELQGCILRVGSPEVDTSDLSIELTRDTDHGFDPYATGEINGGNITGNVIVDFKAKKCFLNQYNHKCPFIKGLNE